LGVERSYVSSNIKKVTFTNTGGYVNTEVDKLFDTAREANDPKVRQQAFSAAQKILCEEVPQIWFLELAWPTIHDKKLHNVIKTAMGPNSSFDNVFLS
jgi:peptide/nickel transport system substrate-binding protein